MSEILKGFLAFVTLLVVVGIVPEERPDLKAHIEHTYSRLQQADSATEARRLAELIQLGMSSSNGVDPSELSFTADDVHRLASYFNERDVVELLGEIHKLDESAIDQGFLQKDRADLCRLLRMSVQHLTDEAVQQYEKKLIRLCGYTV